MTKYTDSQLKAMAKHLQNIDNYADVDAVRLNVFIYTVAIKAKVSRQYVEHKIREYSSIQ